VLAAEAKFQVVERRESRIDWESMIASWLHPFWFESLRRANKCRYGVTVLNCLPNDLYSSASSGSQHNKLHSSRFPERAALLQCSMPGGSGEAYRGIRQGLCRADIYRLNAGEWVALFRI